MLNTVKKILISKEFLFRFAATILVLLGITSIKYKFYFLLFSGILLGVYYGLYNDIIWRPTGKLENSFPYRAHQLWIHIICGTIGSISLYFLLGSLDFKCQSVTLQKLSVKEFVLFGIALLGYVGLLPRILWFFSYAQQNLFSKR